MARRFAIAILSDSRIFCEAVAARLVQEPQFKPIGAASNVGDLLAQLHGRSVDVCLLHARAISCTRELISEIKVLVPATDVIILDASDGQAESWFWIDAGAAECLSSGASYASLRTTLCDLAEESPVGARESLLRNTQRHRALAQATGKEAPLRSRRPRTNGKTKIASNGNARRLRIDREGEID